MADFTEATCPHCDATLLVSEKERARPRRCPSCGRGFGGTRSSGAALKPEAPAVEPTPEVVAAQARQYFIRISKDRIQGPYKAADLARYAADGRLQAHHGLSTDRQTWVPAADHEVTARWLAEDGDAAATPAPSVASADPVEVACRGCAFFDATRDRSGLCVRFPPTYRPPTRYRVIGAGPTDPAAIGAETHELKALDGVAACFVEVGADSWCGEWRDRRDPRRRFVDRAAGR